MTICFVLWPLRGLTWDPGIRTRCRTSPVVWTRAACFVTSVSCRGQEKVLYEKNMRFGFGLWFFWRRGWWLRLFFLLHPGDDMGTTCAVRSWQRARTLLLTCREMLGLSSKIKVLSSALVIQHSSSCINYPMVICTFLAMKTKPQLALSWCINSKCSNNVCFQ